MISENLFWIAASKPNIKAETVNKFIVYLHNNHLELKDFLNSNGSFQLNAYPDLNKILDIQKTMNESAAVIDELKKHCIEIISITSEFYSKRLKDNLKVKKSPPVIFAKGNKSLLNEDSVSIVGSRTASDISLMFTDDTARENVKRNKVIVSGYAKGVDRQALDSALKYNGKSIIVLPQGILTFKSGFRLYESEINSGRLLIISTFFPNVKWSIPLAMARNSIIYGLAKEIFVAESNFSGGTWSGVQEGLRNNQIIFVRKPLPEETNANNKLIELGARSYSWHPDKIYEVSLSLDEHVSDLSAFKSPVDLILECLSLTPQSARSIKDSLKLNWSTNKITSILKNSNKAEAIKTKPLKFVKRESQQMEMFLK
ncbi:MAG: DNA-processing protein DprA [bacterium]|nr:DNA-processing protein DprA [bacterium]